MDRIASETPVERSLFFRKVADKIRFPSAIVEKDFWVCWTLKHLFQHPCFGQHLIFKGGTTLSKVYGLIERFSEDIDITIGRKFLGFDGERAPDHPGLSNKKRRKLLKEMGERCSDFVQATMNKELQKDFNLVIGEPGDTWEIVEDDKDPDGQTLLFKYPSEEEPVAYIQPFVRIEMGCRSDTWPTESADVSPFCAEHFPEVFDNARCAVKVLAASRTFWEKATILHQEYHRPMRKPLPERYSRHYYDLAMLARSKFKEVALNDTALLERVVEHKKSFFQCGWANYDAAVPGALHLMPPVFSSQVRARLRKSYQLGLSECPQYGITTYSVIDYFD